MCEVERECDCHPYLRWERPSGDIELEWWDSEQDQLRPDPLAFERQTQKCLICLHIAQNHLNQLCPRHGTLRPPAPAFGWRVTVSNLDGSHPFERAFRTEDAAEAFAWLANWGGKLRARVWEAREG